MGFWAAAVPAIASVASSLLSGDSGGSSSTSQRIQTLSQDQMELLNQLINSTKEQLGTESTAPAMSVPTTEAEQSWLDWVNNLYSTPLAQGTVPYETGTQYAENYYNDVIRPSMLKEYNEVVAPEIKSAYAGPGFYGSARQNAQVTSAEELAYNLAQAKNELIYKEVQSEREALQAAQDRQLQFSTIGQGAGELTRSIEQEAVLENLQRYLMGETVNGQSNIAYNPATTLALNLLGIQPYGYATTSSSSGTSATSAAGTALSSAFAQQSASSLASWLSNYNSSS